MTRILSIDYGDKRIGLALSDILKIIAKPFDTIENKSNKFENKLFSISKELK